jgi:hypothetical protein
MLAGRDNHKVSLIVACWDTKKVAEALLVAYHFTLDGGMRSVPCDPEFC